MWQDWFSCHTWNCSSSLLTGFLVDISRFRSLTVSEGAAGASDALGLETKFVRVVCTFALKPLTCEAVASLISRPHWLVDLTPFFDLAVAADLRFLEADVDSLLTWLDDRFGLSSQSESESPWEKNRTWSQTHFVYIFTIVEAGFKSATWLFLDSSHKVGLLL